MRYALIIEIASCIVVVQVETEAEPLVGIHCKFGTEAVFAVLLVTTVVISDTRIGRERVHEKELIRLFEEETIGVCEDERTVLATVYEDAVLTGSIVVAEGIVFTVEACIERGVHKQMMYSVRSGGDNVAELPVNRPRIMSFGYLLIFGGVVAVLVEIPVVRALCDVAVLVYLIEGTVVLSERSEK
jgi:hypothetical protein